VLTFVSGGWDRFKDGDGEELDEPVIDVDGRLGLGAEVGEAPTPTVIDGIAMGEGGEEKEEKY
jgi:hypothetical protein